MTSTEQIAPLTARHKASKKDADGISASISANPIITPESPKPTEAPARISKLTRLITLLRSPEGATIEAMCEATGWQAHSVRGAMAGTLKRKGLMVISAKPEDGPRRYRVGEAS